MTKLSFERRRFPPEIIRHTIWLCARFALSLRDLEKMLAERGVDVSQESVRRWFLTFGPAIAANIRRSRPRPSDRWHLDEMVVVINARRYWLWRAVDNEGEVLDSPVQPRRDARAAKKPMVNILKRQGFVPTRIVTDRLRPYIAAFRSLGLSAIHDRGLGANNRAENSHQPGRRREHKRQRFKSPGSAQRFLAVYAAAYNTFYHQRHLISRANYKDLRSSSFVAWACASTAT